MRYLDGGIIGGPPRLKDEREGTWSRPGIPVSGPYALSSSGIAGDYLAEILNVRHISTEVGAASGLKCCFAALSKGFTALAIQSYSTASRLGVLEHLNEYLAQFNPGAREKAEKSVVGCTGKAGRWVEEMNQIGLCFADVGGWGEQAKVFREIAGLFEGLADAVEKEQGGGERLKTVDGVVAALRERLENGRRKKGNDQGLTVQELEQGDR